MAILMEDRDRAALAYQRVRDVKELFKGKDEDKGQKRYRSQVRGGSAMIQRNGLGHFLAFLASKGFSNGKLQPGWPMADGLLYQHLGGWLLKALRVQGQVPKPADVLPGKGRTLDPLDFLLHDSCTLEHTMLATREALAYLQWARRFAESHLKEPDEDNP